MTRLVGSLFLLSSLLLLLYGGRLVLDRIRPLAAPSYYPTRNSTVIPTSIKIPALGLHLPIKAAALSGNRWETHKDAVSYLENSPAPGKNGNSILYGHNWPNLLDRLTETKTGDTIVIYYGSKKLLFTVTGIAIVPGSFTLPESGTDESLLTLYTCTGFLDRYRIVITAKADSQAARTSDTSGS